MSFEEDERALCIAAAEEIRVVHTIGAAASLVQRQRALAREQGMSIGGDGIPALDAELNTARAKLAAIEALCDDPKTQTPRDYCEGEWVYDTYVLVSHVRKILSHREIDRDRLEAAAKLCEAWPLVEELLKQVVAPRECPPGEEEWDALCKAEDAVRKALK